MAAQQHQHIQPIQRIHQTHRDIHVVLQTISVIDVEVEQLARRSTRAPSAARGAAPHINSCRYSGFSPTISGCVSKPEEINASIASRGRQQNFRLRLERLRFHAMFQSRPAVFLRRSRCPLARRIQRLRIPAQRLRLLHRALDVVTERTRPVHRELRAQLMPDINRILNAAAAYSRTSGDSAAGPAANTA